MNRLPFTKIDHPVTHILAATDFKDRSAVAVQRAAEFAKHSSARLTLVHVGGWRKASGDRHVLLQREADVIRARYGISVDFVEAKGIAHIEVANIAQRLRADLVVTGFRGGWLRDLLGGSTAQRIRRRVSVPVLAVKARRPWPYRRILWAVEPGNDTQCAARRLVGLFPEARVRVLHACNPVWDGKLAFAGVDGRLRATLNDQALVKAMMELDRWLPATVLRAAYRRIVIGSPVSAILEQADMEPPDLTVLGPSEKSWLERVIAGSVIQAVAPHLPGDALLL